MKCDYWCHSCIKIFSLAFTHTTLIMLLLMYENNFAWRERLSGNSGETLIWATIRHLSGSFRRSFEPSSEWQLCRSRLVNRKVSPSPIQSTLVPSKSGKCERWKMSNTDNIKLSSRINIIIDGYNTLSQLWLTHLAYRLQCNVELSFVNDVDLRIFFFEHSFNFNFVNQLSRHHWRIRPKDNLNG